MANVIYTRFLEVLNNGDYPWDSAVVRAMLIRDTSTYEPDPDHTTIAQLNTGGLVELSASGYSRQTLANKTVTSDTTNDWVKLTADNLNFGNVAAGQTVSAILFFIRVGADDDSDDDIPAIFIDNATNLPLSTGGGAFTVTIPSTGLIKVKQATT